MAKPDDGGPAFPTGEYVDESDKSGLVSGMSLRDWLAGRAMQGLIVEISEPLSSEPDVLEVLRRVAALSYGVADAMLRERARG